MAVEQVHSEKIQEQTEVIIMSHPSERFLAVLFNTDDLVQIRVLNPRRAKNRGTKKTTEAVVKDLLIHPRELPSHIPELQKLNTHGGNILFGLCSRPPKSSDHQSSIERATFLWADLGDCNMVDTQERIRKAKLPTPNCTLIHSQGVHLLWRLRTPVNVASIEGRDDFETRLKGIGLAIGGNLLPDLFRFTPLPGFAFRSPINGSKETPSEHFSEKLHRKFSLSQFAPWNKTGSRILLLLRSAIASGQARLTDRATPAEPGDEGCIGWIDHKAGEILLDSTESSKTANELAEKAGESLDLTPTQMAKRLDQEHLLILDEGDDRLTIRRTIGLSRRAVWGISSDKLAGRAEEEYPAMCANRSRLNSCHVSTHGDSAAMMCHATKLQDI